MKFNAAALVVLATAFFSQALAADAYGHYCAGSRNMGCHKDGVCCGPLDAHGFGICVSKTTTCSDPINVP
ncbi:hypothetical protein M413DRAFT_32064 [Hebeloma cylindrosporum]|uniref:Uncharacterized protein n=1 Tax=Hebeloma cylindrosporum TaxID=76867 RepID=A0A0C3BVD9_HEBCY|nr:hypothetical protein M413DRAFT_32064 [Hebeloma cylindrosporum h7]